MAMPADRLLKLMYEWIQEAEECSSNMKGLADYLESLREDCNAWELVGNTAAVVGSVVSLCAAPFTGGASLVLAGAAVGGIGAGVSVVTKITEQFKSNSRLEKVEEIDKRCNKIADEIQELFKELKEQCPSSNADEIDKHVVKEFLKAMSKRSNQDSDIDIKDLDDLIKHLMDNTVVKTITKRLAYSLIMEVLEVMTVFSLSLEGKAISAAGLAISAASAGGKEIGKVAAIKGVSRFLGGVVGLAFSLKEAKDSWIEAIENKHETEASKSLRDSAKKIDEATKNLSKKLTQIQTMVSEVVNKPRPRRRRSKSESSSSDSSSDEEGELKMALINSRSANKFIKQNDSTLSDLIEHNDLDVLLITETWLPYNNLRRGEFRTILPPNDTAISNPRFFRRAGGVAIVTRLNVTNVVFNYPDTFEYAAASVRRSERDEPTLILNIYRPPEDNHPQFFEELRVLLWEAFSTFRRVVIAGDFNIWMDRPDLAEPRDFQTLLDDFGLRQHVSGPTHRAGHTLDLVIARPDVRVTNVSVQPNHFSDHSTVFFTVNVTRRNRANVDVNDIIGVLGNMPIFKKD